MLVDIDLLFLSMYRKPRETSLLVLEAFIILFLELSLSSLLDFRPPLRSSVPGLIQVAQQCAKQTFTALLVTGDTALAAFFSACVWLLGIIAVDICAGIGAGAVDLDRRVGGLGVCVLF